MFEIKYSLSPGQTDDLLRLYAHEWWTDRRTHLEVERTCSEPELADVVSIELVCQPELTPFYRRRGFSDQVGRSRLMRHTSDPRLTGASAANQVAGAPRRGESP